jgi:hypothetical protein
MAARDPRESFVSEPIEPRPGSFEAAAMARGEPGLPGAFTWRGAEYVVALVVESWRSHGRSPGGTEMYLRKHWYRVATTTGEIMTLYFDRQPRRGRAPAKGRWTLYSWRRGEEGGADG